MPRPFRFGVSTTRPPESRSRWQDWAQRLEADGWSTLLAPDHLGTMSAFAPLVSATDVTTDLRFGTLVANNDLFHPLRLAQEACTVDLLTDGRLELGVGSGWNEPEYRLLDLAYDPPRQRADRQASSVRAMKDAWGGDTRLPGRDGSEGSRAVPEGVQRPHPPLLIGGHGDRIMSLAAREADTVGFTGLTWTGHHLETTGTSIEALAERVTFVQDQAGERFSALELNILTQLVDITDDRRSWIDRAAAYMKVEPDVVRSSPLALVGSVNDVADQLVAARDRLGISYVVVFDRAVDAMTPVVARLTGT